MNEWRIPLIQSNFSMNDIDDYRSTSPEGLSFIVNRNNSLEFKGAHLKAEGFVVELEKLDGKTFVKSCRSL